MLDMHECCTYVANQCCIVGLKCIDGIGQQTGNDCFSVPGFSSEAALPEVRYIPPVILAQQLGLDDQVIADIDQYCGHEEESSKLAVLRYWENNDPAASWQTLAEAVMRVPLYRSTGERIMSIHVSKSKLVLPSPEEIVS